MKFLKTNQIVLMLSVALAMPSCKAQEVNNALPKVENHLKGELDYTHEVLELVQRQVNGEEISLGKINSDGTIHFHRPEFDIKALFEGINSVPVKFQSWFSIDSQCKGRDVFAETPFDDVYAHKYDPIYVKKYGMKIAALYPVSDEKIVSRNDNQRAIFPTEAKYFWFYIDRDIVYKDDCIKTSSWGTDTIELAISANIQFKKGWNFIEENLLEVQNVGEGESQTTTPKSIEFKSILPASKKVKWILKQFAEDEKIQVAKKLYNLTPISKEAFEKWVPNTLGDLSLTVEEYGNPPRGRKNKNNIHLVYSNETEKKKIELYVVDCAKNPDDMEGINFAYAMENKGKDEKEIKPYIAQYSERDQTMNLLYNVEDRLLVTATSEYGSAEDLWEYVKKLDVKKLLK